MSIDKEIDWKKKMSWKLEGLIRKSAEASNGALHSVNKVKGIFSLSFCRVYFCGPSQS